MPTRSVSEITSILSTAISDESTLQDVWVSGRILDLRRLISNVNPRIWALKLRDANNNQKIGCAIFEENERLTENWRDGDNVLVKGRISVQTNRSQYRFDIQEERPLRTVVDPSSISVGTLIETLRNTLTEHSARVQGEIAEVFVANAGYTILKLRDVTADEEVNDIIECVLPPSVEPPCPLQPGDRLTVEGECDIFSGANRYQIIIDNSNGITRPAPEQQTSNRCQECGQRCEGHQLCPICYYAQVPHEGIVVGAVLRYFRASRFENFSTEREYGIQMGSISCRADVVLLNNDRDLKAIAECKRIGYDGDTGIEQLESYLNASGTELGLFADDTDPYEWIFLKRNPAQNGFNQISRSQFERELGVDPAPEILPNQTRLEIIRGNIVEAEVEAIVNAANAELTRGSGVDGAIRDAGGEEITRACNEIIQNEGVCPPGRAVITTGGNLDARYVIHTVGPIWQGGTVHEAETLATCYRNSLQLAGETGIQSIAFPAISTGNYNYPIEEATPVALRTVKDFVEAAQQNNETIPRLIQFFLLQEEAYVCYVEALSSLGFRLSCILGEDN